MPDTSCPSHALGFDPDGAILTFHHEKFFDEKARDDHLYGWAGCLDKLVRYFAGAA